MESRVYGSRILVKNTFCFGFVYTQVCVYGSIEVWWSLSRGKCQQCVINTTEDLCLPGKWQSHEQEEQLAWENWVWIPVFTLRSCVTWGLSFLTSALPSDDENKTPAPPRLMWEGGAWCAQWKERWTRNQNPQVVCSALWLISPDWAGCFTSQLQPHHP